MSKSDNMKEDGSILFGLKTLEEVLPPLVNKIGFENLLKEMQCILNVSELTEFFPSGNKRKLEEPSAFAEFFREEEKLSKKQKKEEKKSKILDVQKFENLGCKFKYNAEKRDKYIRNKIKSKINMDEKLKVFVEDASVDGVLLSRLVDILKVLKILTRFCEHVFETLKNFVELPADTDELLEIAASNIKQLMCLKSGLPTYLVDRYNCSKLYIDFCDDFYMEYFLNFFTKDESAEDYVLRTDVVGHLQELARWLELYIPLLVKLSGLVSKLNGKTLPDEWEELYCDFLREQGKKFSEFKFSDSPCENVYFALKLIYIVQVLIEDVKKELPEFDRVNLPTKLDVRSQNLL